MSPLARQPRPEATRAADASSQATGIAIEAIHSAQLSPSLCVDAFRLHNGLKILLANDPRAPVFAYQTWFQVGSRDEDPSRTGLAHLFEHLMFKGTTTRPSGTFDAEMESRGAQTNAATWVDWTYYTQALAARGDNLETLIGFESDRMHNLVLDEATFKSELEVVKNERRMAVDNAVSGVLSETLFSLAFAKHPYRWPTIGSMAHLEEASLDDLESFYREHYVPNRACVVICGDFDLDQTLLALVRGYGALKPSPSSRRVMPQEPEQQSARTAAISRPVLAPQIALGFVAPAEGSREHAALEMVLSLLTDGDTALLYEALVTREKLASEVSGFLTPFACPGLCEVHVVANQDASVEHILRVTRDILWRAGEAVTEAARQKAANQLAFAAYDGLRDIESVAEALGHHETNAGDFERAFGLPQLYASIGVDEMKRVAQQIFVAERENVVVATNDSPSASQEAR